MSDLHWLTATETARAFAERRLSPLELLESLLERIEHLDPSLSAFVWLDAEGALRAGRAAESDIAAGRHRGPLHGIPIGIKDVIDVAGMPTTCHSKILQGNIAATDAEAVARLRRMGAIIVGKLATHEFATGGPCFDLPFPPARNPWNLDCHPGGSSSGAGAAVAAGLLPLAIGTDSTGSARHPASACGIVGLKPTNGLVSRRGIFPLSYTLDQIGVLGRTVADVALAMDAIAGNERWLADASGSARWFDRDLASGVRSLRIGFVRHFSEGDAAAHKEVIAALDEAARVLVHEGAKVDDVRLPELRAFATTGNVILRGEAWSVHAPWLRHRPQDYGRLTRTRLMSGAFLSAGDYVGAQRSRARLIESTDAALQGFDVLMSVSSLDLPCRIDDPEAIAKTYSREARVPFSVTGHPAMTLMTGISRNGLPLSVQFIGHHHDEVTLLRVGAAYERATGWHKVRPPIE